MGLEKILKRGKNFFRKAAIIGAVSLPLLFYNCEKEKIKEDLGHPETIIKEKSGNTNSNGEIYFTDNSTLEEIIVEVIGNKNKHISDIQVDFTDGEGYEVFWLRDLSGKYLPTLGVFEHNSKHLIKMEESDKGISEIYTLDKDSSLGKVVWEWRDSECIGFSKYAYEKTIDYEEYLGIQERGSEIVDLLWKGVEYFLGISSPKKPSEIIEILFPEEENPPKRWDFYNYWDGQNKYFTLIPSNIPEGKIDNLEVDEFNVSVFWHGEDKDTYEKFVFLPDNRDLTRYADGNSTSDLKYSYRIIKDGDVYDNWDWTEYSLENSANINIGNSGDYTLELRVKDEVENIGETSKNFSLELPPELPPDEDDNEEEPSGERNEARILYTVRKGNGDREIWVIDSDGNNQTKLTNGSGGLNPSDRSPSWFPDRSGIIFSTKRKGFSQIYTMDSDGSNQKPLANKSVPGFVPILSPTGEKVAFVVSKIISDYEDIYTINFDGSNKMPLTYQEGRDGFPNWSPDGTKIIFDSNRKNTYSSAKFWEIYSMNSDGLNVVPLTENDFEDRYPVWSPDGTKIAFSSRRDGNLEIYVMNSDGSGKINLTNNSINDTEPSWSPDGKKISFTSWRGGDENWDIYIMNSDGSNQTNITNNSAYNYEPAWD